MKYLQTVYGDDSTTKCEMQFIFTPKHGSWLNIIESFFGKMVRTMLWGIRVFSKKELKDRIIKYTNEVSNDPVVFKWKYKMDLLSVI